MLRLRSTAALVPSLLLAAACAESPTAPSTDSPPAIAPNPSVVTPFLLPPGADWGLYFQSFNQNRTLNARVIHYPSGSVTGNGSFVIPGARSGVLRVSAATPYGNCIPNGHVCDEDHHVPESAIASGTATFLSGRQVPFTLDLHSNFWPNPTNTYDAARLTLCYTSTNCASYSFYGELHHEPQ
jgi:hypothetical protein